MTKLFDADDFRSSELDKLLFGVSKEVHQASGCNGRLCLPVSLERVRCRCNNNHPIIAIVCTPLRHYQKISNMSPVYLLFSPSHNGPAVTDKAT